MTRFAWAVVVLAGCQSQPVLEVSLSGEPFEVKDAVFFSMQTPLGPPSTFVVFGDEPDLCRAFEDRRNVCNARTVPDVHDGIVSTLARPVGVRKPLGWLVLRSAAEGAAVVVPDQLGLSTPGATLTEGSRKALHATKNRVIIDHFVAGDAAVFSFESEFADGRPFRGRVEASWCPALDTVRRHNASLFQSGGTTSGPVPEGYQVVAECGGESIVERCTSAADGTENCTCQRAGQSSTCSVTIDPSRPRESCCGLRFGD